MRPTRTTKTFGSAREKKNKSESFPHKMNERPDCLAKCGQPHPHPPLMKHREDRPAATVATENLFFAASAPRLQDARLAFAASPEEANLSADKTTTTKVEGVATDGFSL